MDGESVPRPCTRPGCKFAHDPETATCKEEYDALLAQEAELANRVAIIELKGALSSGSAQGLAGELDTEHRDAAGRLDTEASLRSLLEAALQPRFPQGAAEVVTFYGEGPTGLAGGLALRRGAPDFALGRKVGCYLMDAAS